MTNLDLVTVFIGIIDTCSEADLRKKHESIYEKLPGLLEGDKAGLIFRAKY